jgi:heat shock protein 1/8
VLILVSKNIALDISMDDVFEGQIGIDLGTTYSCVGFWNQDHVEIIPNENGNNTTPSWVAFIEDEIIVGDYAKKQCKNNRKNTIFDIKRLMGKHFSDDDVQDDIEHFPFQVVSNANGIPLIQVEHKGEIKQYWPEQISALILEKMRKIAEAYIGKRVRKAVITVPAYFNDSQRVATKQAAKIAGLECDKIINEPTAACLCYGLDKKTDGTNILIFDLGGGTFDVSLLHLSSGVFEVLATSGNTHLGGEDFDNIIMGKLLEEFCLKNQLNPQEVRNNISDKVLKKLKDEAETAKKILSTATITTIEIDNFYNNEDLITKLSRSKFESWCLPLFRKCLDPVRKVMEDAGIESGQVAEVVLVGGSTRIPKVQSLLSDYFGGIILNKSVNPDEAVAYGAAVQGAILSKNDTSGKTQELLLMDVTSLSLGIESKGGVMSKIIDRNSQIPVRKSKVYSTVEDGQTSVLIKIYEGERQFTADNHILGEFVLDQIPRQARGAAKIEVIFNLDGNGILSIKAVDKETGNCEELEISNSSRLDPETIARMIDEAEEFRADDEVRKNAMLAREQFEKELAFVQQSITDPELNCDEEGNAILAEEVYSFMNQFILNNLAWLEENCDLTKDVIDQAKTVFNNTIKDHMSRIYARKKQLDMSRKYVKDEVEPTVEDVQKLTDSVFT